MSSNKQAAYKLREKAKNKNDWNLSTDAKVLTFMIIIRRNLSQRAASICSEMDDMLEMMDTIRIQLQNTTNKLVGLQKTHFIEQSVQDNDEPSIADAVDAQSTKATAEEILKKMLKETVSAVDKCYEKVLLDWSDSDLEDQGEDDIIGRTMFRATDTYKDRPRPFLIGSEEWKRTKFAGIIEERVSERHSIATPLLPPPVTMQSEKREETYHSHIPVIVDRLIKDDTRKPALYEERYFTPPDLSSDDERQVIKKSGPMEQPSILATSKNVFFNDTPPVPTAAVARKKPNLFADLEDDDNDDEFVVSVPKAPPIHWFNDDDKPPELDIFGDNVDGEQHVVRRKEDKSDGHYLFAPRTINNSEEPIVDKSDDKLNNNYQEERIKPIPTSLDDNKNIVPIKSQKRNDENKFNADQSKLSKSNTPTVEVNFKQPPGLLILRNDLLKLSEEKVDERFRKKITSKGLFDDLDYDDYDQFPITQPIERVSIQTVAKSEFESRQSTSMKSTLLFNDNENDKPRHLIVGNYEEPKNNELLQEKAVPVGKDVEITCKYKFRGLFDDGDKEYDLSRPNEMVISRAGEPKSPNSDVRPKSKQGPPLTIKSHLFDSEDEVDDDIFSPKNSINFNREKEEQVRIIKNQEKQRFGQQVFEQTVQPVEKEIVRNETGTSEKERKAAEGKKSLAQKYSDEQQQENSMETQEDKVRRVAEPDNLGEEARRVELRITQELERQRLEEQELQKLRKRKAERQKYNVFADLDQEYLQIPAQEYGNQISLFSEPPPDLPKDSDILKVVEAEDTESSDDESLFNERKSIQMAKPPVRKSVDLFSDLPPDDDEVDPSYIDISGETASQEPYTCVERPPNIESLQCVKYLIKSHEVPSEYVPKNKLLPKIVPNKLNNNLKINVMAILPGAKPSTEKSIDVLEKTRKKCEMSPERQKSMEISEFDFTPTAKISQNVSVLCSLNKSRAKISTMRRRPSTREGRKESLRRSLLFHSDDGSVENDINPIKNPYGAPDKGKELTKNCHEISALEDQTNKGSKSRKLFESDEDDDDLLEPAPIKLPITNFEKTQPREVPSSLFSGDGVDSGDDIFSNVSTPQPTKVPERMVKREAVRTSTSENPLADLL